MHTLDYLQLRPPRESHVQRTCTKYCTLVHEQVKQWHGGGRWAYEKQADLSVVGDDAVMDYEEAYTANKQVTIITRTRIT